MRINVAHLISTASSRSGGLATSIKGLINAQHDIGINSNIIALDQKHFKEEVKAIKSQRNNFLLPPIIHSHGLWLDHSNTAYNLQKQGHNHIITPHGMLDKWALNQNKFRKKIAWNLRQKNIMQKADCIHALCLSELYSIRSSNIETPVAVIPNGVILPDISVKSKQLLPPPKWHKKGVPHNVPILLFLGRFSKIEISPK